MFLVLLLFAILAKFFAGYPKTFKPKSLKGFALPHRCFQYQLYKNYFFNFKSLIYFFAAVTKCCLNTTLKMYTNNLHFFWTTNR